MTNPVMVEARAAEEAAGRRAEHLLTGARDAFQKYYRWLDQKHSGSFNDRGCDADKRLRQSVLIMQATNHLLSECRAFSVATDLDMELAERVGKEAALAEWAARLEREHQALGPGEFNHRFEWIELHTEQFYWCSFRARTAIRKLPGLNRFEAVGVRNVRNKLIEHPDGADSRVFNAGFGFGGPQGPALATARTDRQPNVWPDPGLFANSNEFALNLVTEITAFLASAT